MCFKTAKERTTDLFEIPSSAEDELGVTGGGRSHKQASLRSLQRRGIIIRQLQTSHPPVPHRHRGPPAAAPDSFLLLPKEIQTSHLHMLFMWSTTNQPTICPLGQHGAQENLPDRILQEFFKITQGPWKSCWESMIWASLGGAEGKSEQQSPCKVPGEENAVLLQSLRYGQEAGAQRALLCCDLSWLSTDRQQTNSLNRASIPP